MTVTPGKFRSDLETVLAMGYTPVLPRELAAGDALPEKPILITFDDGYLSNYEYAWPILEKYGMVATILWWGPPRAIPSTTKTPRTPLPPTSPTSRGQRWWPPGDLPAEPHL